MKNEAVNRRFEDIKQEKDVSKAKVSRGRHRTPLYFGWVAFYSITPLLLLLVSVIIEQPVNVFIPLYSLSMGWTMILDRRATVPSLFLYAVSGIGAVVITTLQLVGVISNMSMIILAYFITVFILVILTSALNIRNRGA